jgi:uncharacterized membrane protein (DUF2068 family)
VDWSLRACGRRGHVTWSPDEEDLRARLHVHTPAGPAWRCLRCGDFVLGEPAGSGPADEAPIVLRGRALRDAVVLRLLALERAVRALVLFALAYGVLRFRRSQGSLRATFERALPADKPLQDALHVDLTDSAAAARLQSILSSRPHTLGLLALGLTAYGAIEAIEAIGLAVMRRWGEYVAVVGTSALLPLEVRELLERTTFVRAFAFVANVLAVVYLVATKRLFGVRGGKATHERERASTSLLEVEAAALEQPPPG